MEEIPDWKKKAQVLVCKYVINKNCLPAVKRMRKSTFFRWQIRKIIQLTLSGTLLKSTFLTIFEETNGVLARFLGVAVIRESAISFKTILSLLILNWKRGHLAHFKPVFRLSGTKLIKKSTSANFPRGQRYAYILIRSLSISQHGISFHRQISPQCARK